jgi:hypothetical protein
MIARVARCSALLVVFACLVHGAEEAPKSTMKSRLKALIAEDAKKADGRKAPAPSAAAPAQTAPAAVAPTADTAKAPAPPAKAASPAPKEPPTVMPKVEVRKGRITELDQKLAKQDQDIAREKKNLKSSEVDDALNDAKIARPLAIFGGESSQFRKRVASERVELMEAEKDMMEAIAQARTKEEKAELQKQLDELRSVRRELEKSLR